MKKKQRSKLAGKRAWFTAEEFAIMNTYQTAYKNKEKTETKKGYKTIESNKLFEK